MTVSREVPCPRQNMLTNCQQKPSVGYELCASHHCWPQVQHSLANSKMEIGELLQKMTEKTLLNGVRGTGRAFKQALLHILPPLLHSCARPGASDFAFLPQFPPM